MTADELDLVDEIFGPAPDKSAGQPTAPESIRWESTSTAGSSVSVSPRRRFRLRNPLARAGFTNSRAWRAARIALVFAVGAIASLLVVAAIAMVALSSFSNRVVPGVRVGSVDVSGLSRDQVVARLQSAYGYLGEGEVSIATPVGAATITYQQAGREADVQFMADAALRIGHSGNPIDDAVFMLRSAVNGQSVPIVVRVDPTALATRVRELVATNQILPRDASATARNGTFGYWPATTGSRIEETTISGAIIDRLMQPDAPSRVEFGTDFVALNPKISDQNAQDAAAAAQRMVVDIALTWGGANPNASPTPKPIPPKTYKLDSGTIWSWILFGTRADGSYGPYLDSAQVQTYISGLAPKVAIPAVEPSVVYDAAGKPAKLAGGKDGLGIDVPATTIALQAHLDSLASGHNPGSTLAMVTTPVSPKITLTSLSGMVLIGQGSWTTVFYPDVSNGFGANIRTPAKLLNGQVVAAGQQFSFLRAVGPIDPAHGYTLGGVIERGKSNHTGAMGGGICSASTTMFNAAARAGLQIDERHAHFYYISRYPVGLDATVFSNGSQVWDLKWTNDTPNPIMIRASSTRGSRSTITIQLWSFPLDRKVTFSPEFKANVVKPVDRRQYVSSLKPGQQVRKEYPTIGFDTSRTRTVTDSTGAVIHRDTWKSHYTRVNGLLQVGAAAPASIPQPGAPAPVPANSTSTTPTPAILTPAPSPAPILRRRKVR
jgi:vancomycin resistance protein YoaR